MSVSLRNWFCLSGHIHFLTLTEEHDGHPVSDKTIVLLTPWLNHEAIGYVISMYFMLRGLSPYETACLHVTDYEKMRQDYIDHVPSTNEYKISDVEKFDRVIQWLKQEKSGEERSVHFRPFEG